MAKQSNSRLALALAILIATPFLGIPALSLPDPLGTGMFIAALLISFSLFIWTILKWVNTYPSLAVGDASIIEYGPDGRETVIPFRDLRNFGYTRYGANYSIRFQSRSTRKTFRYMPQKRRKAAVEEFRAFASQLDAAIRNYNTREAAGNMAVAQPIEIGLSKPEKATNVMRRVYQVIIYVLFLFVAIGLLANPGLDRTIGILLLAWLLGAPLVVWLLGKRKRRRSKIAA